MISVSYIFWRVIGPECVHCSTLTTAVVLAGDDGTLPPSHRHYCCITAQLGAAMVKIKYNSPRTALVYYGMLGFLAEGGNFSLTVIITNLARK
jgi:hypothetical protein